MLKKWLQLLKKDERGLTLVELLAVIVILAIVGAIAFVAVGNITDNAKKDAHVANAQQIISAAKLAEASGTEITSTGVETTALDTISTLTNPWTKEPYTGTVKKADGVYTVVLSSGNNDCDINNTEADINKGRETVCK